MQAATAGDERRNWITAFMKHALPTSRKPEGNSETTVQSCNTAMATQIKSKQNIVNGRNATCLTVHLKPKLLVSINVIEHTHTSLMAHFSGSTRVSRYQKGKSKWISLKQEWVAVASAGLYACLHLAPDR